ncbi:hypothetical protein U9R62_10080 [Cylindrospermopsis raciborskii DSH]|uniref:hypothetical protein n=1 Tax=Cylindrospermopsis raciborskii TaxID=77022 RepID=UPI002ED835D7
MKPNTLIFLQIILHTLEGIAIALFAKGGEHQMIVGSVEKRFPLLLGGEKQTNLPSVTNYLGLYNLKWLYNRKTP